ncbi:MAG: histidine ammonia-lyase [Crocinitomicaceae bacterium]|jgi:histidine ammonia-lyase|nr:histidine ammonia-lyase [Crocinitomicaceae bacterium]
MLKKIIDNGWMSLAELDEVLNNGSRLELSAEAKQKISACRTYLDEKVAKSDRLIYGVNTGFGSLCDTAISSEDLEQLQRNLVLSHACGLGETVPAELVKRMLLLKVMGLSHGNSGVQLETVERLIFFFNNDILPVVYQQGSLGASGDLAPLAHLCLPLLGEGEVVFEGKVYPSAEILKRFNLEPIRLRSKEGLALLNGTQFMSTYASWSVSKSRQLWNNWNKIAVLSLEGYDGRKEPFNANVNEIRRQKGQIETAEIFRGLIQGSEIAFREKAHVQDPYSFRCIPQVHGASKDAIDYCAEIVEREINAVTDNPTVFPEDDEVVSAGNFHGQPLALTMDFLAIAIAEMGSISERRIYKLISGTRGLPAFLVANPGLNSGFMIPQYTCASIVSQNKQLCTPASVDTIDSSNGQEDHVSMGANAATKLYRVVENCFKIQGIEILNAAQAFEFRRPLKSSPVIEKLFADFRQKVAFVNEDRYQHPLMKESVDFVKNL